MKKTLPLLGIATGMALSLAIPVSAQAGTHYNCANPTGGCVAVKNVTKRNSYTETKYPVVMAHGLLGFNRMFGFIDYYYGIPKELIKGGTDVFATKVSAVHDSEFRGEQLLRQVKTITAITGKEKVNLIGHSQGGIDIRYVAGVAPEYVASVTAVSSPEQGSETADWLMKHIVGGTAEDGLNEDNISIPAKIVVKLMNVIGGATDVAVGIPLDQIQQQNGWQSANGLTSGYLKKFNKKFPAAMPTSYCGKPTETKVNGIPYYSIMGVGQMTNIFDPLDYVLLGASKAFGELENDGLVSVCSSRLGKTIRDDYRMNHGDTINQFMGITAWREAKPYTLYRNHINRLKSVDGL